MADPQSSFRAVLATLASDPGFREFARADAALLLWDLDGTRLLWGSPEAASLRASLVQDEEGRLAASLPVRPQLRALGQGLAPASGARLERLHLDGSRLTPPVICACRRVTLPSGEGALLTAVIGPVPKLSRAATISGLSAEPAAGVGHAKDMSHRDPAGPASGVHGVGTVRFLWHTDASGRFTYCSDALAEVVGPASAAIVGRTWDEIHGELVLDARGAVSEHFARGKTWSGEAVQWRLTGTNRALSVDLAGAPVFDAKRQFLGFRGFGLCRPADVSEWQPNPPKGAAASSPRLLQDQVTKSFAPNPSSRLRVVDTDETARMQSAPAMEVARAARPGEHRPFPHLSPEERAAFREIARALGARFDGEGELSDPSRPAAEVVPVHRTQPAHPQALAVLDSLPVGLLVYRGETPLFANRLLLDLAGYADVRALAKDGVSRLFPGRSPTLVRFEEDALPLTLSTLRNESLPVDVRLASLQWDGVPAVAMVVRRLPDDDPTPRLRALELDLRASEARLRELASILDTATDGVIVLDEAGRILSLNRSAEALFGYDQREVAGETLTVLLASASHDAALDYLDGLRGSGVAGLLNDGREVLGRVRQGGAIPLFMTAGRASEAPERKFCVVLRDITALKKAEAELFAAKRAAEEASAEKSDFLAKVSHELRTPLNAIIGFAEVMIEERFGPMGNERYKDYLKDIHNSGRRVLSLVNGLLDLAKIEAGRMDLSFAGVSLNDLVASCVSALSNNATRERIVIRTSFASNLPPVVADQRSLRESVVNIITNAVKFTDAGGQVIVSTAMADRGEVVIRVRDTGIGMTDDEVEAALKPLRQLAIARKGGGAGLGLPLAKALVEANRGALRITSVPGEGTLVEIVFPPTRVLASG